MTSPLRPQLTASSSSSHPLTHFRSRSAFSGHSLAKPASDPVSEKSSNEYVVEEMKEGSEEVREGDFL